MKLKHCSNSQRQQIPFKYLLWKKTRLPIKSLYPGPTPRWGISRPSPPNHCLYPSEDCAPKESNRTGTTGAYFGACAPPKYCLCPPSVRKASFQDEKHEWTKILRRSLRFRAEDLVFWSSPQICGQEPKLAPLDSVVPRQAVNVPPQPHPERELYRRYLQGVIWNEDIFLVITPELEEKFICAPQNSFSDPSPVSLLWRRAWLYHLDKAKKIGYFTIILIIFSDSILIFCNFFWCVRISYFVFFFFFDLTYILFSSKCILNKNYDNTQ